MKKKFHTNIKIDASPCIAHVSIIVLNVFTMDYHKLFLHLKAVCIHISC